MPEPKISLLIYGTRLSNAGWEPLVMLNNPPFPLLENKGVAGVSNNPTYYVLRIDRDYTQYTLAYNPSHIKANGAVRDGALKVAISIPKGYALADGASPYNVLIDLQRVLQESALTPIVGRADAFEFKSVFPPEDVFRSVLDSFRLVEAQMPHRPMSPTTTEVGLVMAGGQRADALFRDVQYPEFARYREIAIAAVVEPSPDLRDLTIPREAKYGIVVNNRDVTLSLKGYNYDYNAPIRIDVLSLLGLDGNIYEPKTLEFTVGQILNGKYPLPSKDVKVDKANERIFLSVEPVKRRVSYQIVPMVNGKESSDAVKYLKIYLNGRQKNISKDGKIELVGEDINRPMFKIEVDGKTYTLSGQPQTQNGLIIVPLKPVERLKAFTNTKGNDRRVGTNTGNGSGVFSFRLILKDPEAINDGYQSYRVRFSNQKRTFVQSCRFEHDKNTNFWYTEIEIPSAWADRYEIGLKTDVVRAYDEIFCDLDPNARSVEIGRDDLYKLSWKDDVPKKSIILGVCCFVLGILLTLASIWAYDKFFNKEETDDQRVGDTEQVTTDSKDTDDDEPTETVDENTSPLLQEMQNYQLHLSEESVSFEEIKKMAEWAEKNAADLEPIEGGPEFKEKIGIYNKVIKLLNPPKNRKVQDIRYTITHTNAKNIIEPSHFNKLEGLWTITENGKKRELLDSDKNYTATINNGLKKDREYGSFLDVPSADDIIQQAATRTTTQRAAQRTTKRTTKQTTKQQQQQSKNPPTGEVRKG